MPPVVASQNLPVHDQALQIDLDGLFLNTELPQRPVYIRIVEETFGHKAEASDFAGLQGASMEATVAGLNERFGKLNLRDPSVLDAHHSVGEYLVNRMVEIRRVEIAVRGVELMPDALALLDMADRGRVRRGIATSRAEEVARAMLEAAGQGILPRLDSVVGKNSAGVTAAKPAPDIGRVSARRLGTVPENCWALEDSPSGVLGQAAAGARVLYVPDLRVAGIDPASRRVATHTVTSLGEAISFLERELGV